MCEPISFQEIKLENGWLMIKPLREDMWKVFAFLKKMRDRIYQLELREYRKKRSLDANAYAWTLIGKLAAETRIPKEEVYREAIRNIGGNCEVIPIRSVAVKKFTESWSKNGIGWQCEDMGASKFPGYRNLIVYYGSSVYDTRQMSILIDRLIQDCKAVGIETIPEDKLRMLLEQWDGKEEKHGGY